MLSLNRNPLLLQFCLDSAPDDGQLKCWLPADEALFHQLHHLQALDQLFGQPLVANQPPFARFALTSKKRDRAERVALAPGEALCRLGWAGVLKGGQNKCYSFTSAAGPASAGQSFVGSATSSAGSGSRS